MPSTTHPRVEGPSDRVYLEHWIEVIAPELIEGIHYSIMFYGGRLLSHLSANDDDLNEFIGLRSLNQHLAIVMDSDKSNSDDEINATKLRVLSELGTGPSLAWVTEGREIENYIDHEILQKAVKEVHPENYGRAASGGKYDHALHYARTDSGITQTTVDKVKVAKLVCQQPANLEILDLSDRLDEIVRMIRAANA